MPSGHSNQPEPPAAESQHSDSPGARNRYILYVGQLIRGKGVDLLLRAFSLLATDYPELGLSIAGAGNALAALRSLAAELKLDSRVRFEGSIPSAKLDSLYRGAECLVVPSRWPEPFGMIGLEAMRKSIPIVGFASGGIPDWLRDGINGFLVPCADISALAKAIRSLLDDPGLAKAMGKAGRAIAAAEFSFQSSIDLLIVHLTPAPFETSHPRVEFRRNRMRIGIPLSGCDLGKSGISRYLIEILRSFALLPGDEEYLLFGTAEAGEVFMPRSPRFSSSPSTKKRQGPFRTSSGTPRGCAVSANGTASMSCSSPPRTGGFPSSPVFPPSVPCTISPAST